MLSDYLPIIVLAVLAAIFAVASLVASALLAPRKPNPVKLMAYESGNDPVRLPRGQRFSVKFYVVAMLFIIFDIETIFLFPWAIAFRQLGLFGLIEMTIFIGLVFVAYVYVWKKGGFDWAGSEVTPIERGHGAPSERELADVRPGDDPGDRRAGGRKGAIGAR